MVVTVNPEFVMRARSQAEFHRALEGADLCLADGAGVVWALRRRGCVNSERVTGADTVPELARICAQHGLGLFLLGAAPGVAEAAGQALVQAYPGLLISGTHSGSPAVEEDDEIVAMVNRSGAAVLLVAYGHPAQELWIARNREQLKVALAMGVGGVLDFLSGRVRRAPASWRRANLEWLWRLVHQPWRARRMLALPLFALLVVLERA